MCTLTRARIMCAVLKRAFDAFAQDKGYIEQHMVGTILQMLGHELSEQRLQEIIAEVDADGECASLYVYSRTLHSRYTYILSINVPLTPFFTKRFFSSFLARITPV